MDIQDQCTDQIRYQYIPRVLIFVFDATGRVLLLKGAKGKRLWANQWNGIGGHVEVGESVKAAAQRELAEETGITCQELYLCGLVAIDTAQNPGIMMFVYTTRGIEVDVTESAEGELAWFMPAEMKGISCVEDIPFLVQKCDKYNVGDEPFDALYKFDSGGRLLIMCD